MIQKHRRPWLIVVLTCLVFPSATTLLAQLPVVRIGMVLDGPWERNEEIRTAFERETTVLLEDEFEVRFPLDARIEADYTAERVQAALENLLANPEVELVIALGPLASHFSGRREDLPKPVIAPFVIDQALQGLPLTEGASGRQNLSYVITGGNADRDIRQFRRIVPFQRLTFLISGGLQEFLSEIGSRFSTRMNQEFGIQVTVIPVERSMESALQAIPEDAEAVYLSPLQQLEAGAFDRLVAGLIDRGLPSFSMWGRSEVEAGLLASLALDHDFPRLARRVALNIQRILLGEEAGSLPVAFPRSERLTINMATARALQVYPSWELITEADLLQETRTDLDRHLTLASAIQEAVAVNLDIAGAERTVVAGIERIRRADSALRPQIGVSGASRLIDKDRADASFGSAGRLTSQGSFGINQLVYSEPARATAEIERHRQTAREQERDQVRLDVMQEAAVAYLNVLRAKTVEQIQKDNLRLTIANLESARSRQALGASGPGEVFRWENQIANNRRSVIDSIAARNQSEIALNRILHHPLEESFGTQEASMDDPALTLNFRGLTPYVGNPGVFRVFREFMVEEALNNSPETKGLDALIGAQERNLEAARRSFYVPEISVQANVTGIGKAGSASSLPALPQGLTFPASGNVDWTVALSGSLPLFTSGARRSEVRRSEEELAALRLQREATAERIAQRVRSELHAAGASFAGIQLAATAAQAGRNNLALVADAYTSGVLRILDLLDAQNAALISELAAASAIYDFLIDLMRVERAIGRVAFLEDLPEQQIFFQRMDTYFEDAGFPVESSARGD